MKARVWAVAGAGLAGILVLLPIPVMDLLMMVAMQFVIAVGVMGLSRRRIGLTKLVPLILAYALVGSGVGVCLEVGLLFLGKFLLAPFAFFWCYLLGELLLLVGTELPET
jgi:hypothetical protein